MNLVYFSVLEDTEKRLRPLLYEPNLQLLGELDIEEKECHLIGRAIGERCQQRGLTRALRDFKRETPCTFAVFLAAQGIWGYDEQQYWPSIKQLIGVDLSASQQGEWGDVFSEILANLNKPLFNNIEGHRHVKVILAHGGIPQYCLPDFFTHLLQPAITYQRYADLDTPNLIEELLERAATNFADKPVRRFLRYGGQIAANFFARCCLMAREFSETNQMPSAVDVGLPARIVAAYQQWVLTHALPPRAIEPELRLRKPEFIFNPWGGFVFKLPPQSIPREFSQATFAWRIRVENETHTINLRLRPGFDQRTAEREFPVEHPAKVYEVSYMINGQIRRTWRFEGMAAEKPLMLFEAGGGRWQRLSRDIPPQPVWLVFPKNGRLEPTGPAQLVSLPECFGGWVDYAAQEIDLSQATQLTLYHAGQAISWKISTEAAERKPHFVGGVPFTIPQPSRQAALYVGEPPTIRIPLSGKQPPLVELENWRITLRNREAAAPMCRVTCRITELKPFIAEAQNFAEVRLNMPNLLGPAPCGTYDIYLRGPLGRDAELPLRIWQDLSVKPLPSICWPDPTKGPLEVPVTLFTLPQDKLTCPKEEGRIETTQSGIAQTTCHHTVWAGLDTTVLHLNLSRQTRSGEVSIPLEIPIPRPRWLLRDENMPATQLEWSAQMLQESLEALNQMTTPALWVSMPVLSDTLFQTQLRLIAAGQPSTSAWQAKRPEQQQWRFSLGQFRDELRVSRETLLRFELACKGLLEGKTELTTYILSVTQKLLAENIHLSLFKDKGQKVLRLTWHEPKQRLRYRHVRLWPVWAPWQPPIGIDIPDNASGLHEIPFKWAESRWRVQFKIKDPFVSEATVISLPAEDNVIDIDLASPAQRLSLLEEKIKQDPSNTFQFRLEQAHIQETLGDMPTALRLAHWCSKHVENGRLPEILALHDLAQRLNDPALPALEAAIFTPHTIQTWLERWRRKEAIANQIEAYLQRIPPSCFAALPAQLYRWMLDIEEAQQAALNQLLRLQDPAAIDQTLTLLRQRRLTESEALELLALGGQFALETLTQHPADEAAMRLALDLAPRLGTEAFVVTRGMWLHTDAGWGRIDEILDPASMQPVSYFVRHERGHRLRATLRPTHDAEPIEIDFPAEEVIFSRGGTIYYCAECQQFAATDKQLVEKHYHAVHTRRLLNPAQRWGGDNTLLMTEAYLRFLHAAPKNEME